MNEQITSKIKSLGLVETTTEKQVKNGTREFLDPQTNTHYASYATGYVRRLHRYSRTYVNMYPVNKRSKDDSAENACILLRKKADRMDLLIKAVETYRITSKVNSMRMKFPDLSDKCLKELAAKNYEYLKFFAKSDAF